jgi:hypothetical protein
VFAAWAFWPVWVVGILAALLGWIGLAGLRARATRLTTTARVAAKTAVLLLKVYPMLPSRPLDWVTPRPVVERFGYPTSPQVNATRVVERNVRIAGAADTLGQVKGDVIALTSSRRARSIASTRARFRTPATGERAGTVT